MGIPPQMMKTVTVCATEKQWSKQECEANSDFDAAFIDLHGKEECSREIDAISLLHPFLAQWYVRIDVLSNGWLQQ